MKATISKIQLITFLIIIISWFPLNGQDILDQYVQEGLRNNQQLIQEALAVKSSELALLQAKGLFMPSANFESSYTLAGGGRTIQLPLGDLFNPVYSTLNGLTNSQFPTDMENINEQFLPNDFHDTKIRLIQPLFNTDIYYNRKASEQLVMMAQARKEAYEAELIKEIKVGYFNFLLTSEVIKIYDSNIPVLKELLRFNQLRFKEDQITIDEVYRAEFELEELMAGLATAEEQAATAKAYFNFLLNKSSDFPIEIDHGLLVNVTFNDSIDITKTYQNRKELKQVQSAQEAQQYAIKLAQGNHLPKINGVLDMGFQGFGYEFNNEQDYYLLNLSLSWSLFNGFQNKNNIQRQRLELQRLESTETQLQNQISLEVIRAEKAFFAAQKRFVSKSAAQKSASKGFEITNNRYREGQALLVEYLDAQSVSISADFEVSIAKYQLLAKQVELQQVLAY